MLASSEFRLLEYMVALVVALVVVGRIVTSKRSITVPLLRGWLQREIGRAHV